MGEQDEISQLVVVGSSAGGIDALSTLVSTLPADFGAPMVIAQHLEPSRTSHLQEILSRVSTLPVETVEDHQPLRRGVVFVVPANRHVDVTDHELRVRETSRAPKPSIDLLLSTASDVFGENLIAVVLTGMGSDGAAGALQVKKAGGTIVIQDPRTAAFPGLPLSLSPAAVDFVSNIGDIGPLLQELLDVAYVPATSDDEQALRALLALLQECSGIDFGSYKQPTIMRRLRRRMVATKRDTIQDYLRYLRAHPDEYRQLVSTFLIKVTEFFRDPELYAYLRETVLPDLIESAGRRNNELRIWSAGAATGEEAYSLAILVADLLGDRLEQFNVRVFATDLDAAAIEYARRGVYPAAALEGVPQDLRDKYFVAEGSEYQIRKQVRGLMVFGEHDLAERAPFPRIDLLVCRNVLIYFGSELQRHVLQLFAFSLRDGGYLVLGKSETVTPLSEYYVPDQPQLKIYRRRGDRAHVPLTRARNDGRGGHLRVPVPQPSSRQVIPSRLLAGTQQPSSSAEHWDTALHQLPVGVVIVDKQYDIRFINAAAREMVGIHGPAPGEDLVHLAQNLPGRELRRCIDDAYRGSQPSEIKEVAIEDPTTGRLRYLDITCLRYLGTRYASGVDSVMVVIADVSDAVRARQALEQNQQREHEEVARLSDQVRQLVEINAALRQANENLTAADMDLRSANEEFMVGNEELQAASEEVETLNEELQATNEELETLNEELQATVEELNATNDDLEARSVELQDLAVSLEAERRTTETERARLSAILVSMGDAVLVVDRSGKAVMTNAAYTRLFGQDADALAPKDINGIPIPPEQRPQARASRGESFSMDFTVHQPDGSRCYFEADGRPIGSNGDLEGGVIVIRDITERSLRRLQDQFLAMASHELRTPLTVLNGYLGMLQRQPVESERIRRYAQAAGEQARRMDRLIHDLLDVARLQSGRLSLQRETVDLRDVLARAVQAAQLLTEQRIELSRARTSLPVNGDPERLQQIFLNVLLNAIYHASESPRIAVRSRRLRSQVEVQIQDWGPGIPPDELPNLFARFHQGEQQAQGSTSGLGLGLFITRELVTVHGGAIDVESTAGQGTTFKVRLPLDETASRPGADGSAG